MLTSRSEAAEHRREFDADRARADHHQRLRHLRQIEDFDIGENEFVVRLEAGQHTRFRSGGDENVLRRERLHAFIGLHFDRARALDRAVPFDDLDLVLLHQKLDAFGVFLHDAVLAVDHLRVIEHRLFNRDTFVGRVVGEAPQFRGMQERLGRNAADMQAGAAQLRVFFNNGGFQTVLARAHRRRVAAGAATNHNQIVCHVTSFYMARLSHMREMARISLVLLLFVSGLCAQTRSFPIDSITIEGNKILSAGAITSAAGLKHGDTGNSAIFDAARDRLIASGYFETVGYRYKPSATERIRRDFRSEGNPDAVPHSRRCSRRVHRRRLPPG